MSDDEAELTKRIKNGEGEAVTGDIKYLHVGNLHSYWYLAADNKLYESTVEYASDYLPKDYRDSLLSTVEIKRNEVECAIYGHPEDKLVRDGTFCLKCLGEIHE